VGAIAGRDSSLHGGLENELAGAFGDGPASWSDDRFQALALRIFEAQYEGSATYRRFCQGRDRTPGSVSRWEDVPPVPTAAFKALDLFSGPGEPEAVFLTSGTTGTRGRPRTRGRHPILSLALYRAASLPWLCRHLVPDGATLPIFCLVPSPDDAPTSSLSTMMGFLSDAAGAPGSAFFAEADGALRYRALRTRLEEAAGIREPVLLMGTAFAWVHWLDRAREEGFRVRLPDGSRLMETGGFKGRSREVPRWELYRTLSDTLGVPVHRMVNEYGMTELLSQLYEPVLVDGAPERLEERVHRPPPWLRVRALDPDTLEPRAPGQRGLLAFFDLANLGSVSAVLTQDVGQVSQAGDVALEGRAPGSEPRGCSLAMEELMMEDRG